MLPAKQVLQEIVDEATNMMLDRQMKMAKGFALDVQQLKKSGHSSDEIKCIMKEKFGVRAKS